MKNFIIILAIIAVLFIGYKTLSKKGANTNIQTPDIIEEETQNKDQQITQSEEPSGMEKTKTPTGQKTVNYTVNGFEPSSITISVGETVLFTNTAEKSMWIASNPHPTHTDLPFFDENEGVEKNYWFTFEKKGTWGYHNHLSPKDKGTIIVE